MENIYLIAKNFISYVAESIKDDYTAVKGWISRENED